MKLWDVASEKELAEAPDFPVSAGSSTFAPDGTLEAVMEGTRVFLRPASGTEDLTRFLRGRYFSLPDREVVWGLNDSLLSARSFPVLHPRPDLVAQLAESSLSPAQRLAIRAQLCGICGAWRRLPPLWQEVQDAGLNRDPGLRPVLALQFAIAARFLAVPNKPVFPRELWEPLRDLIDPEAFSNPSFSLAMARLVPGYLRADEVSFESKAAMVETVLKINPDAFSNPSFSLAMTQLMPVFLGADEVSSESKAAMIETVLKICPVPWLTAVVQRIVAEKGEDRPALSPMASAFVRRSSERHPGSSELLRAALASYLQTDAAHTPLENRLLALPDAEGGDFTAAAYAAAKRGETDRARTLLEQARSRFSKDESVHRMAGWSYLNLNDFDAALTAFEAAKARVEEGQRPDTDLLAGLSIAQWLSGEQQAAVESYRELIEAGRKKEEPTDWADASTVEALTWPNSEKVPLEAVRAATLEKHPELTPKNEDTKE